MRAAAQHPCRLLVVVRRRPTPPSRGSTPRSPIGGRLGPGEAVVMRMYGRLALHAESVVLPLLAPDAPVVTWWNGEPPAAHRPRPAGRLRRPPGHRLRRRRRPARRAAPAGRRLRAGRHRPGLGPHHPVARPARLRLRQRPGRAAGGPVSAEPGSPSAALLAGWLSSAARRRGRAGRPRRQRPCSEVDDRRARARRLVVARARRPPARR